ncbi:MAG: hypothetical protein K2G44_04115 [Clostridia bacterium]|nr:hypothetical protein [Clostridia bacterium]
MKRSNETFLNVLRARWREQRNAELASRLEIPRTTEDMISALRALETIGAHECAAAEKKELELA